jgi:hypothetical protein
MDCHQRRLFSIVFLSGLVLLAIARAGGATTLTRLAFKDLANESTAVARLRCLSSGSLWGHGEIWTETKFEVVEVEKGLLPGILTVRQLGGHVGHLHSRVDGIPIFRPGEEVYLFLWKNGEDYSVLGWSQGTFRIFRNPVSGEETVTQESTGASIFDPQRREFRREGIRNLPVAIFREKLRMALERKP